VGFLGPVVAAPPTGAEALRLWDAVVTWRRDRCGGALASPPPGPEIPGLRLPQP